MNRIEIIPGLEITDISLGAGARGNGPEADAIQFDVMDRYLALGGNCFDTARMYAGGACDESLGAYLRSRGNRNRVVLCTKGNHPENREAMHVSRLSPGEIELDLTLSLKAIGVDHTDLHLLHRDDPNIPVERIVPALDKLVTSGKARAVGVSNWTVGRIQEANDFARANGLTPLSLCQLHYSLLQTSAPQTGDVTHVPMNAYEFAWYARNSFPVMGFGCQGRGFFARCAAGEPQKPGPMRYYGHYRDNALRAERLIELSRSLGHSVASLALAYVRGNALRASALCGFSSVAQLEDALEALTFALTPEQIRYLEVGE